MDTNNENKSTPMSNKYLYLLVVGTVRLFLCTTFWLMTNSALFEAFGKLIRAYQKFETYMLPTIILAVLPLVFAELDNHKYESNQYMKRAIVCTVVWIAATFVQIKFIQLGF